MPLTDAQKRAQATYRKKSVRQAVVKFYPAEVDVWEWLQTQDNRSGYIKQLIRDDMERKS